MSPRPLFPSSLLPLFLGFSAFAAEISPGPEGFAQKVKPFFEANCIGCHGPKKTKGDIALHKLEADLKNSQHLEHWGTILDTLKAGEMPPDDEPQPDKAEVQAVVRWIEAGLRGAAETNAPVERAPLTRRLTNIEYENTMADLFGFRLKLIENLPEDPVQPYRFNNTAEFMRIGPEQMDRYRENARRMLAGAIVSPGKPKVHKTVKTFESKAPVEQGMMWDEIGVYGNGRFTAGQGIGLTSWPETGEFRIRFKASGIFPKGTTELPLRLVMGSHLNENLSTLRMEPVGTVTVRNNADHPQIYELRGRMENFPARPGENTPKGIGPPSMTITPQNLYDNGQLNDNLVGFNDSWAFTVPRAVVASIEFEAPIADVWPPEHHTRILFESPLRESDPKAYVRAVLARFLPRAFRRPVAPTEIERFAKVHELNAGAFPTFEEAIRETLSLALVSPDFLYHTLAAEGGATRQFELASRLSYFLWASMPDAELFSLAAQGRLSDPAVLEKQALRLLADPRSQSFVGNFTEQWLGVGKVKGVSINRDLFPRFLYLVHLGERAGEEVPYRPTIRDYMQAETFGFIGELIRRNASLLNILDSDFAYLNQPLAAHYGVEGVEGHELRPVPLKPGHRLGGVLTHGSILIGNSTGSAPHPIYRAVWLREAILGDEVKPPPAAVPALADTAGVEVENATTIAEMLRKHRQVESCHDCHARLDPWGIPFEQYNSIGKFQPKVPAPKVKVRKYNPAVDKSLADYQAYLDKINLVPVLATARVPKGPEVNGMADLKAYLLREKSGEVAENVLRRLLTYSLGRELTLRDRAAVERLLQQSKANNLKLRDLILAICASETFRTG